MKTNFARMQKIENVANRGKWKKQTKKKKKTSRGEAFPIRPKIVPIWTSPGKQITAAVTWNRTFLGAEKNQQKYQ